MAITINVSEFNASAGVTWDASGQIVITYGVQKINGTLIYVVGKARTTRGGEHLVRRPDGYGTEYKYDPDYRWVSSDSYRCDITGQRVFTDPRKYQIDAPTSKQTDKIYAMLRAAADTLTPEQIAALDHACLDWHRQQYEEARDELGQRTTKLHLFTVSLPPLDADEREIDNLIQTLGWEVSSALSTFRRVRSSYIAVRKYYKEQEQKEATVCG